MEKPLFSLDELQGSGLPPLNKEMVAASAAPEVKNKIQPEESIKVDAPVAEKKAAPVEVNPPATEGVDKNSEAPVAEDEEETAGSSANDDEEEEAEVEVKDKKDKKTKPRDPYAWGQCPVTITIQIMKTDEKKRQLVRVGVHTHSDPTEPPKIATMHIDTVPHPLPDYFWKGITEKVAELVEEVVKGFPDREATWKANKTHKEDPAPTVRNASKGTVHAGSRKPAKKDEKQKPPSIEKSTLSLFNQE